VHRDLKPGNVIMSADGPRIIDFGIARDANASTLTATGMVMGTFSFMSPEQVRADQAGPASDVFSLGCVLAYAGTGQAPFDAPTIPAIVHRIINEPPRLDGITGDLQLTITACLAKNPADRPTVPDLLAQLTTPGAGPKTDPAAIVAAAAAPAPPPQPHPARPVGPLAIKHTEPPPMDLAGERQPTKLEPSPSGMSRRALLLGAGAVAGAAVAVAVPAVIFWPRSNDSGGSGGPIAVVAMTFSTDGTTLIAVGGDGADSVWRCDMTTGRSTVTRLGTTGNVLAVALGPGGKTLARSEGNTIQHWNVATGSSVTLKGHTAGVRDVSFNRAGTVLASVGNDKTVRIWDLTSGNTTAFFRNKDTDAPSALVFSPDGTLLAVGSSDGNNVRLLDAKSARLKATLKEFNYIRTVEFSPDGRTLAIGGSGTRLWNLDPGSHTKSFSDQADTGVNAVFSPDGKTLASGGFKELQGGAASSTGVRIWDVTSSRLIRSLPPAAPPLAFSPDGRTLATGGDKVRLWNVTTGALIRTL
jgi:DNA-binding beta-propeller fold protein YncE